METQTMDYKPPLVSVLTPTWNRADYLDRVWKGLNSQTYRNFEWIVCDDGSIDGTQAKLTELCAKSRFPITIINASVHIGKARMDNAAIEQARGEFILWNDSDDYLVPQALEKLVSTWNSIPTGDHAAYMGVAALCGTEEGDVLNSLPEGTQFDTTWNELTVTHQLRGDFVLFTKAHLLKKHRFPEVDFVIPEGVVWTTLGNMRVRVLPTPLKIVEYRTPHCISFSGKMEYCRGRAYAMATSERNLRMYPRSWATRAWRLITFHRYGLHGELPFRESLALWGSNSSLVMFWLMLPFAALLAAKDRLQGKVRRTHREFISANQQVSITLSCHNFQSPAPLH